VNVPSRPEAGQGKILPPLWFFFAILLQLFCHFVIPVSVIVGWPWDLFGAALIFGGFAITVYADWQFKRANTPVHPYERPLTLVTQGVFGFTRNPMYLGLTIALLGIAMVLGTLTPFVVPPLFAWLITVRFIRSEEAILSAQFGETYNEYARRVRRWL
jgi:protein-S-isoprenylcysteine O-methyltransferase Ste14